MPYVEGMEVGGVIWNSRYVEYAISIQQDMSKAQSTSLEDVYIIFDFDAAILTLYGETTVGVTNPKIQLCQPTVIVAGETDIGDVKSLQVIVDLETLKPSGLCACNVVVDPEYMGSYLRMYVMPPRTYTCSYCYEIRGVSFKKEITGLIPT